MDEKRTCKHCCWSEANDSNNKTSLKGVYFDCNFNPPTVQAFDRDRHLNPEEFMMRPLVFGSNFCSKFTEKVGD